MALQPSHFDVYRSNPPFATDTPVSVFNACRLVPDYANGSAQQVKSWDYYMDCPAQVDIRDGQKGFVVGNTIADQDTIAIPSGNSMSLQFQFNEATKYVVVYVELHYRDQPQEFKRVYLDRLEPNWDNP